MRGVSTEQSDTRIPFGGKEHVTFLQPHFYE